MGPVVQYGGTRGYAEGCGRALLYQSVGGTGNGCEAHTHSGSGVVRRYRALTRTLGGYRRFANSRSRPGRVAIAMAVVVGRRKEKEGCTKAKFFSAPQLAQRRLRPRPTRDR